MLSSFRSRRPSVLQVEALEDRAVPTLFPAELPLSSLGGSNGFSISGVADNNGEIWNLSGSSVSGAGDVNGDGFDDLIIGAPFASAGEEFSSSNGQAYVVFGKSGAFPVGLNLDSLDGTNGFALIGVDPGAQLGSSVAAAGDVNGDGFDDVIIGAPGFDFQGSLRGVSYVVLGKSSGFAPTVFLSTRQDFGSLDGGNGFAIFANTGADGDLLGSSVSGAGDVNGDGFDDMIVGAPGANAGGTDRGQSYVVFGRRETGFAVLPTLTLNGVADGDRSGSAVNGAGDVNGDGFDDLIIGAAGADLGGNNRGQSYVVFGKADGLSGTLELSSLDGTNGFALNGSADNDESGHAVSEAGDVNADGIDDLIIGAPEADAGGTDRGQSYVVFGKSGGFAASLNLSSLNGTNGFTLNGIGDEGASGYSVSEAGDVNGDGLDDLLIGARFVGNDEHPARGQSYVVFGNSNGVAASLNLNSLDGRNGFALNGIAHDDFSGWAVSGAGDVNGDGFEDILIGAPDALKGGTLGVRNPAGQSYVVFGRGSLIAAGPDQGSGPQVQVFHADGSFRFSLFPYPDNFTGGVRVAVGDVNGDGQPDIVTGPGPGLYARIHAYDGRTGERIRFSLSDGFVAYSPSFTRGVHVAVGDVNGDGKSEIVVSPNSGAQPVRVFDTRGVRLLSFLPFGNGYSAGIRVAVGDVSGGPEAEIVTMGGTLNSQVRIFRIAGTTATQVLSFSAFSTAGAFVAVGDVDGSGKAEIIAGAGKKRAAQVKVFDGTTGVQQGSTISAYPGFTGGVRVATVERRDRIEILTAPGSGLTPRVKRFHGLTHAELDAFFAYEEDFPGGLFVAGG